jgi:tripartite motif-containing protein 71
MPGTGPGELGWPIDVAVSRHGRVYVLENANERVSIFTRWGRFLKSFGGPDTFEFPEGIFIDHRQRAYVADGDHEIQVHDRRGSFLFSFASEGSGDGQVLVPKDVAMDSRGRLFVSDGVNTRIQAWEFPDCRTRSLAAG